MDIRHAQGKPEAPFKKKDLSPGYPYFWRLTTAKRTATGLAQVRLPCYTDGRWKRLPSPKTSPGKAHAWDT